MAGDESLFAQKLKRHRVTTGRHGRMTQEQLAEALGVSLDAISKYERSLSFIRGDLEHRLAERLGWSGDEVRACREDWEGRASHAGPVYRLMGQAEVDRHFGGSWRAAADAAVEMSFRSMGEVPDALATEARVYAEITSTFRDLSAAVLFEGLIVAQWVVTPFLEEDEALFRDRRYRETALSVDRLHRPILPGTLFGYSPAFVVARGHERAAACRADRIRRR